MVDLRAAWEDFLRAESAHRKLAGAYSHGLAESNEVDTAWDSFCDSEHVVWAKLSSAESELERLRREHQSLNSLAYVPGSWECPVCGYGEVKSILYAATGNIGVNPEPALPCPNDGATMRPSTWKGHAEAMDKYAAKVEAERLMLAKLASREPMFDNPLHVWEAEAVRGRVLGVSSPPGAPAQGKPR